MKRYSILVLLAACTVTVGCGSDAPPTPPALDSQTREAIAIEDKSIDDAEANQ
ncbi:hypothetical protein [Novipirellula caenicola]|uniref:Secreted protein n=1 Tax=Novipirellula caenicola TaxID=1536901 RepID=A0ABP9W091_9BACT